MEYLLQVDVFVGIVIIILSISLYIISNPIHQHVAIGNHNQREAGFYITPTCEEMQNIMMVYIFKLFQ